MLQHGMLSPYWDWFIHGDPPNPGIFSFRRLAYEKPSIGILPTSFDPTTAKHSIHYDAFAFKVLNDPKSKNYNAKAPTEIEITYTGKGKDPILETFPAQKDQGVSLTNSDTAVLTYSFPISTQELATKRETMKQQHIEWSSEPAKKMLTQWENFRLTESSQDDSTVKWDGKGSIPKLNSRNPAVQSYLLNAAVSDAQEDYNILVSAVAKGLHEAEHRIPVQPMPS